MLAKRLPKETVEALEVLLVGKVTRYERYTVVGSSDINAMLDFEKMKGAGLGAWQGLDL